MQWLLSNYLHTKTLSVAEIPQTGEESSVLKYIEETNYLH